MFAAGAMKGYPEVVEDSEFKVFLNGNVKGTEFYYADPGSFESGTDWSQGWECYGTPLKTFTDAELAKETAT